MLLKSRLMIALMVPLMLALALPAMSFARSNVKRYVVPDPTTPPTETTVEDGQLVLMRRG